jgi:hypothetical protein
VVRVMLIMYVRCTSGLGHFFEIYSLLVHIDAIRQVCPMGSGNPDLLAQGRRRGEIAGQLARFVLAGVASGLASRRSTCGQISSQCEGERDLA